MSTLGLPIMDPLLAFMGEEDETELCSITNSAGISVWKEDNPVHLTDTACLRGHCRVSACDHLPPPLLGSDLKVSSLFPPRLWPSTEASTRVDCRLQLRRRHCRGNLRGCSLEEAAEATGEIPHSGTALVGAGGHRKKSASKEKTNNY